MEHTWQSELDSVQIRQQPGLESVKRPAVKSVIQISLHEQIAMHLDDLNKQAKLSFPPFLA